MDFAPCGARAGAFPRRPARLFEKRRPKNLFYISKNPAGFLRGSVRFDYSAGSAGGSADERPLEHDCMEMGACFALKNTSSLHLLIKILYYAFQNAFTI